MLLVIDVGNTQTVLGLYVGEQLVKRFRIQTDVRRTSDETGVLLLSLFDHGGVDAAVTGAIVSCVVPDTLRNLLATCRDFFDVEPLVVGPGIRTGMPILADNPREVGADRIVNAVAAFERVGGSCIVVDFGTATTFDCISAKGQYLGGVIAPGYQISAEALFSRTSKLPRVEVERPRKVIGKNTVHSMQSGLFYGYVSLVDGMVERIRAELGSEARVLATGGLASVLAEASTTIEEVCDDLTLDGLQLLFSRGQ
ncbi:MAG: type III pantothenate kinase [Deltaproteobacteria bacterium]|nr:type III pantothenate kinase [Deltaproteobacteria bacterium]